MKMLDVRETQLHFAAQYFANPVFDNVRVDALMTNIMQQGFGSKFPGMVATFQQIRMINNTEQIQDILYTLSRHLQQYEWRRG